MTDIINAFTKGVYDRLTGGTALTNLLHSTTSVYHQQAPEAATLPYVVYSIQAGGDENDSPIRSLNYVAWIRCYSDTSAKGAGDIDTQVDGLLHFGSLTVTGFNNIWMARESTIALSEQVPSGGYVYTAGGYYRIILTE